MNFLKNVFAQAKSELAPYKYECILIQGVWLCGSLRGKNILKIEKASQKSWVKRNQLFMTKNFVP